MLEFSHPLPLDKMVKERHPFIVNRCRGKSVLHVGCVDAGLLEERLLTGDLLHKKIFDVATTLYGIDIDENGIQFLKNKGFSNLYALDLIQETDTSSYSLPVFDVIILSEVLEHLLNPGLMLDRLKSLMKPAHTELLISVPNAFSINNIISMIKGFEHVHPDHNYYFSYVTFRNVINKSKLQIKEQYVYIFDTDLFPKKILNEFVDTDKEDISNLSKLLQQPTSELLAKRIYWQFKKSSYKEFLSKITYATLSTFLLHRNRYWGDGLILVCQLY